MFDYCQVGSDTSNRKGLGVSIDDVYALGSDIREVGWSDAVPDPCCIMRKPGDSAALEFNKALVRSSEGRLPEVDEHTMNYFACSCNHTVWFLKCVGAALPCGDPSVSLNGRLSIAAISETDKLFGDRVREGLKWTVLNWRVREFYPELVELIIDAKNAPGEINRRASAFEVLTQIFNLSKSTKDAEGYPDWARVSRLIARTKPPCLGMLPELVKFVVACSGGEDGAYLRELTDLWKNNGLGGLTRNVPSKIWKALAESECPNGEPMARFKTMFVLTTLSAEGKTVEDGVCNFLSPQDCNIFAAQKASTKERLINCNEALEKGFRIISQCASASCSAGPSRPDLRDPNPSYISVAGSEREPRSQLTLNFATRLVRFALSENKNRQRSAHTFESVEAIGGALLNKLQEIYPTEFGKLPTDLFGTWTWNAVEEKGTGKTGAEKSQPQGVRLKEIGRDGQLAKLEDQLNQAGFKVGEHVKMKTTNDLWIIASCETGSIVLKDLPAKAMTATTKTVKDFLAKYAKPPSGYEAKLLHPDPSWQELDPRASKSGAVALAKMDVLAALEIAARVHPDASQAVQPMLNLKDGFAGVQAASNAKAGAIVLVPWTNNIVVEFPDDQNFKKPAPWTVEMQGESPLAAFAHEGCTPRISLISQGFSTAKASQGKQAEQDKPKTQIAVFWRLQGFTEKEKKPEEINMEVGHITVDALGHVTEQSKNIGVKHRKKPDFAETARITKVIIPVLVNRKEVCQGDLLTFSKISVAKEEKPAKPIRQDNLLENLLRGGQGDEPAERANKKAKLA